MSVLDKIYMPRKPKTRRAVRRAVQSDCNVVSLETFRVIGEEVLDISTQGMLVATDTDDIALNEVVAVRFTLPGDRRYFNAEAEVARIVCGRRIEDTYASVGLRFTRLSKRSRNDLLVRLAGYPPPIPARPHRFRKRHALPRGIFQFR